MGTLTESRYRTPFVLATTLFFMWGFARNILTVLNKHFQEAFSIGIAESAWVEVSTFLAYFVMALPAGWVVSKWGYKRGMVSGLACFAIGCLCFIPCTLMGTFWALIGALFVVAIGLVFLEVAANPYVTRLGSESTSSARLNRAQSFNGLGGILAPAIAGWLLLAPNTLSTADGGSQVVIPYTVMGIFVAIIAVIFSRVKLPEIKNIGDEGNGESGKCETWKSRSQGIGLSSRFFIFALVALLAYEIAEICINSYFINFLSGMGWMSAVHASSLLSGGLLLFMCGRLLGSWAMQRIAAPRVLLGCAIGSVVCVSSIVLLGNVCVWADEVVMSLTLVALLLNFLFESIMFPTIYSLALEGLSAASLGRAGSILMMTPVGGCSFLLMGMLGDSVGGVLPFLLPLGGYLLVLVYALWRARQ